jgi:aspartate carbamoyltransferase catalytic subunit
MNSLISTKNLIIEEIKQFFEITDYFSKLKSNLSVLKNKTIATVFFENSTRTKISFETSAKKLGANVISFAGETSSINKGESEKDTLQTLEAIGANAFVIRHSSSGIMEHILNQKWIDVPIVNGGDGAHEHPSQALYDIYTMAKHFNLFTKNGLFTPQKEPFIGKNIAIVGDLLHSRVARSNINLLKMLGATIHLVAPKTLMLNESENKYYYLDDALKQNLDVIMFLRVQNERMKNNYIPSEKEYSFLYGLTENRLNKLSSNTLIMHPGPVNRNIELSSKAVDSPNSVILEQVKNSVFMRMAILFKTFYPEFDIVKTKELCNT